jgi:hypothetical protein
VLTTGEKQESATLERARAANATIVASAARPNPILHATA